MFEIRVCVAVAALCIADSGSAQNSPFGTWRIERGVVAPWVGAATTAPDTRAWLGRTVRIEANRVVGPGVLACGRARFEQAPVPAKGMFQGNLPAPAAASAEALGVARFPVPGVHLNCDTGLFDFHRVDNSTMLIAVDNVIWTMSRAPGALAVPSAANGVVQAFLEHHFAGDMGFDRATVAAKEKWLADTLRLAIAAYFRRPRPTDEVPPIDGDPFTDSQEYPTRFAVGSADLRAGAANVSVKFADAFRETTMVYVLRRQGAEWRIADVRSADGTPLTKLLKQ